MNRAAVPVLILICAAMGVAIAVQRSSLSTTQHEIDQVGARVERLEAKAEGSVARKAVEELQEQVARVERKAAAATVAAEGGRHVRRPARPEGTPTPPSPSPRTTSPKSSRRASRKSSRRTTRSWRQRFEDAALSSCPRS
jgi:hypothetical protein